MKRTLSFLSLIVSISFASLAQSAAAPQLSRAPYLQQSTENSIVIVWRTVGATEPIVRYGESPDTLNNTISDAAISIRTSVDVSTTGESSPLYDDPKEEEKKNSTALNTYQYEAHLTGLAPGSKRYYGIFDGDDLLAGGDEQHFFHTNPPLGSPTNMRIWVVGDSGTGREDQAAVYQAMLDYVAKDGRPLDSYIHVGDMAYSNGTDFEFQRGFFSPYAPTLSQIVCWPSMGNHEGRTSRGLTGTGPYYDAYVVPTKGEVGGAPSGTEAYYSFNIAEVHFICLDSHDLDRSPNSAMAQWLRADLEQTTAKWLVAFWHHPPYTKGSHDSDKETQLIEMRENFMPILESAGVDLTLTGHSHIYERSMLLDGAYATPTVSENVVLDDGDGSPSGDGAYRKSEGLNPNEGSVSVVSGHGGAGLGRSGTMPVMKQIIVEHGSVILDIDGGTLTGVMIDKYGDQRDLFRIVKRGSVTPTRIENPWKPIPAPSELTKVDLDFSDEKPGRTPADLRIVRGSPKNLVVAAGKNNNPAKQTLWASSGDEQLLALYKPWKTKQFKFEAELRFPDETDQGIGILFGYRDSDNYYSVYFDQVENTARIIQTIDQIETIIAEYPLAIPTGRWVDLEVEYEHGQLDFQFEDEDSGSEASSFRLQLGDEVPKSNLGFYLLPDCKVQIKEIEIKRED